MVVCPRSGSFILPQSLARFPGFGRVNRIDLLDDLDVVGGVHTAHRSRRDEDELFTDGVSSSFDLWRQRSELCFSFDTKGQSYHFPHTDFPIDTVHEDVASTCQPMLRKELMVYVQLIKTPHRGTHGIPQRKKQTDRGERLFAPGQRFRFPALAHPSPIGLDVQVQLLLLVVGEQSPSEITFTQHPHELDPGSGGDGSLESLPALLPVDQGGFEQLLIWISKGFLGVDSRFLHT